MATKNLIKRTSQKLVACRSITISSRRERSLWTAEKIVTSPHPNVDIPNRTITEHIWENNLGKWPDNTAIICGMTQRSYTFHQLYKYSRNFAAKLRTLLKIKDGDVAFVMMPNSPEYTLVFFGVLEAGAEVTTVNPIYTSHEVERQIKLSSPKVLIGVPESIPVLKEALSLAKIDLPIITVIGSEGILPSGTISFEEFALTDDVDQSVLREVNRKPGDVALLPYSSGTTGLPKGVELTHKNMIVNLLQQGVDSIRFYNETTKTNQDTALAILPFYHIYGLSVVLLQKLSVGIKVVTLPKFQPATFLNVLKEQQINLLCAAPPLVLFLGSHDGVTKEHLQSVRTLTTAAAPIPRNDINKVLEKAQPRVNFINMYGMTETSPMITANVPGSVTYSTVGNVMSNTKVMIADSDMQPLGPDEVGELLVRGPQVMKGYRNNPVATSQAITEDGWLKTGDLASIDTNGVVTIADRLKELIKVKGYQVPPAELENVLKDHPNILDAAVVGVPDSRMGEAPKAFVVLKEGHKIEAESVTSFVAKRVAEYKRIREVMFLDAIPKNPSGKILRRVLKDKYC